MRAMIADLRMKFSENRLPALCGAVCVLLACVVMLGWFTQQRAIIQILPGFAPMQFNTALCFALIGMGLMLSSVEHRALAAALGCIAATIGFMTLTEYIFDINLGIDEYFVAHYIMDATSHPGRMAPNTALSFSIAGSALLIMSLRIPAIIKASMAEVMGTLILALAIMALVGYTVGAVGGYTWGTLTQMALHTSFAFFIFGLGFMTLASGKAVLQGNWVYFVLVVAGFFVVAAADLSLHSNVAVGVGYAPLIIASLFFGRIGTSFVLASVASVLVVLGEIAAGHTYEAPSVVLLNAPLSLIAVWIAAIAVFASKRSAEQLSKAKDAAEAASHHKSEFLANMSHELRTPLNGIIGGCGVLKNPPPDSSDDWVEMISDSASALLAIVNDILDLARIESGQIELQRGLVDLSEFSSRAMNGVKSLAQQKGIDTSITIDGSEDLTVMVDEKRLRQVLVNLLGNAIKFTDKGIVSLEGGVLPGNPRRVWFEVIDTGIGIPGEKLPHVFNRFWQVDGSMTRRAGGAGLGLAIVNEIVHAMDGTISVKSVVGEGTCFRVEVPCARAVSASKGVAAA